MDQCWSCCCRMFFFACGIFHDMLRLLGHAPGFLRALPWWCQSPHKDGNQDLHGHSNPESFWIVNHFESWLMAIYSLLFSYQQNVFHILLSTRSWTTEEITCPIHVLGLLVVVVHCGTLKPSQLLRQSKSSKCRASNAHAVTGPLFTGPAMKTMGKKYMTFEKGSGQ